MQLYFYAKGHGLNVSKKMTKQQICELLAF